MNTHAPTLPANHAPRFWHRYSLGQRLLRFALYLLLVAAIVQAIRGVEVIPEFLYDAPEQMADLFQRMWPVDWALSLIHISEPTRHFKRSRMPSSA